MLSTPSILLNFPSDNKKSMLFDKVEYVITFCYGNNLDNFFNKIESSLNKGYWLTGYFCYEFGYFLEPELNHLIKPQKEPFVWLAATNKPDLISSKALINSYIKNNFYLNTPKTSINFNSYIHDLKYIKNNLKKGDTYQVNHTFKLKFKVQGDPLSLYMNLRKYQKTNYGAFIQTEKLKILSLSPELFFKIDNNTITCKPMKGTIKRGLNKKEDNIYKNDLLKNNKTIAENLMIVDLIRNDLGKISNHIKVSKLFQIETYPTLHQMTSEINAKLNSNLNTRKIMKAIFPCGSITGAPKIRTMEIINQLEKEKRGIYTGAIGYISPEHKYCFNVPIRTLVIEKDNGILGIGGGIIFDSNENSEYKEAILKSRFITDKAQNFSLIETLKWEKNKSYILLNNHLNRLKKSLKFFSIPFNMIKLRNNLRKIEKTFTKQQYKIRILVKLDSSFKIIFKELKPSNKKIVSIKLSEKIINQEDIFLYHKTTKRKIYNQERNSLKGTYIFEKIFCNKNKELTEGTITNLFMFKDNILYTPPLKCGLLNGILRETLLKEKKAIEKIIYLKDLLNADKIFIGNSLRGLIEAKLQV